MRERGTAWLSSAFRSRRDTSSCSPGPWGTPTPSTPTRATRPRPRSAGIIAPPTFVQPSAQFDPDYPLRPKLGQPWFGSGRNPTGRPAGGRVAAEAADGWRHRAARRAGVHVPPPAPRRRRPLQRIPAGRAMGEAGAVRQAGVLRVDHRVPRPERRAGRHRPERRRHDRAPRRPRRTADGADRAHSCRWRPPRARPRRRPDPDPDRPVRRRVRATSTPCTPTRCSPPRWPATRRCSPTGCSPWA